VCAAAAGNTYTVDDTLLDAPIGNLVTSNASIGGVAVGASGTYTHRMNLCMTPFLICVGWIPKCLCNCGDPRKHTPWMNHNTRFPVGQRQLLKVVTAQPRKSQHSKKEDGPAEKIMKLKGLLDAGAISQQAYDEKTEKLLAAM
jgi:hypothetical protein